MQYPLLGLLLLTHAVGGCFRGGFDTPPSRSDAQPEDAAGDSGRRDLVDGPAIEATADALPKDAERSDRGDGPFATVCEQPTLPQTVVFCDGSEDSTLAPWAREEVEGGEVAQDSQQAYRGAGSLRATTTASGGVAAAVSPTLGPYSSGELYVRAYFYLPVTADLDDVALIIARESQSPWDHVAFSLWQQTQATMWIEKLKLSTASTIPIPRDRWFCVQLGIGISPVDGWVELWIDDQTAARRTAVDTQVASGYDEVVVGLAWTADTNPPAQIWVDEVVVSEAQVSCGL